MSDKPILFSGPMIRALLAGTKSQTRRYLTAWTDEPPAYAGAGTIIALDENEREYRWSRTHAVGDRLYVRESWQTGMTGDGPQISYRATPDYCAIDAWDGPDEGAGPSFNYDRCPSAKWHDWLPDVLEKDGPWRPGIHMPRWASRLTLTVTDVRVERLQDISEADALAEGMTQATADAIMSTDELQVYATTHIIAPQARGRILYETIWDQINGDDAWALNPWVAAYSFTVEHGNIDQLARAAS